METWPMCVAAAVVALVVLLMYVLGWYPDPRPRVWHITAVLYRRECDFGAEKIAFTVLASSRSAAGDMAREVIRRRYSSSAHWSETTLFEVLSVVPGNPV